MSHTQFQFELYRLVLVESENGLFEQDMKPLSGNKNIAEVVRHAANEAYDQDIETERADYVWALRSFNEYCDDKGSPDTIVVQLGRGVKSIVTPTLASGDFHEERSESEPPTVEYIHLIWNMKRHIVAVEYRSIISKSSRWNNLLQNILKMSARNLGYSSRIELEPVPGKDKVLNLFRSFQKLVVFKLTLRLPNPELSKDSKELYDLMKRGGVQVYAQRMYNPRGLSQESGSLPYSSAEIAEAGYKVGDVHMEGIIGGEMKKKRTGRKAMRSSLDTTRDVARGMLMNIRTKEARICIEAILKEIDREYPPPE